MAPRWRSRPTSRETESVESLVQQAVERFGGVDVVVANAAASAFKPLSQIHGRHVEKTMGLTVQGFLDLVRLSTPHMPSGGRVMAVSGWDSFRALPGHGLLGAAKAAMETIVKYLAIELARRGHHRRRRVPRPDRHRLVPLLRR